jgi:hypothetical protein
MSLNADVAKKRYLSYIIVPNYVFHSQYKKKTLNVFNDKNLEWNTVPVDKFSNYWHQFPEYLCYGYATMKKVLVLLLNEILEEDCTYHRQKYGFFTNLFLHMNMGETLFIRYNTLEDLNSPVDPSKLIKSKN